MGILAATKIMGFACILLKIPLKIILEYIPSHVFFRICSAAEISLRIYLFVNMFSKFVKEKRVSYDFLE